jgi:hypothetical protein
MHACMHGIAAHSRHAAPRIQPKILPGKRHRDKKVPAPRGRNMIRIAGTTLEGIGQPASNRDQQHPSPTNPQPAMRCSSPLPVLHTLLLFALTLTSFVCILVALTSTHWATQAVYSAPVPPTLANRLYQCTSYRGPFRDYPCLLSGTTYANYYYSGACFDADRQYGGWWCQQIGVGQHLLIAGTVFTGVAFLSCIVAVVAVLVGATGTHWMRKTRRHKTREAEVDGQNGVVNDDNLASHHNNRSHTTNQSVINLWRWFTRLMMVLAIVMTASGCLIVTQTLVNQQSYDGNYTTTLPVPVLTDHWVMSRAVVIGNMGWLPTLIAVLCLPASGTMVIPGHGGDRESRL